MAQLYLTNTITRKKEEFVPINSPEVGMYACGMTVYDYAHIGHGRKYVVDDVLKRTLTAFGYKVKHVQNVTDVGHLSSDADEGEDKMEKGAAKEKKSVWDIARKFENHFYTSMDKLNIIRPDVVCRATEHIKEQIDQVEKLIKRGFAYETDEAVYFDVEKFPKYHTLFGQNLTDKLTGVRQEVVVGKEKKIPWDFVLWFKLTGRFKNHVMHWSSPWGEGFPGWHVECSAMSMKYLGDQFDIHTGGEDHISVHHPNEIALSECSTGKEPFANYWIHTAFLNVNGKKMSKSLNNFYRIEDVEKKGIDPIALRYLYLNTHYRKPMNFTWEVLESSASSLLKLKYKVNSLRSQNERKSLSKDKLDKIDEYREKFMEAIGDDLNTSLALSILRQMIDSNIPSEDKYDLAVSFDEVLGLELNKENPKDKQISPEVLALANKRDQARKSQDWREADRLRKEIEKMGYKVKDAVDGGSVVE